MHFLSIIRLSFVFLFNQKYYSAMLTPNVYLYIDATTKKGKIIDATNYTEEGIVLAQVNAKGLGVVTAPTGVVIKDGSSVGSPLVNLASTTESAWFNLPLDTNGNILNGTYAFTYNLHYSITNGNIDAVDAPSTFLIEFTQTGRVLQAGDSIVTIGNDDTANNGTFTVATASYNEGDDQSTITVTATSLVTAVPPDTGTYSFSVTRANFAGSSYTWNGCDLATMTVSTTYNCEDTQFGQLIVEDTTNYNGQEIVSRAWQVYYPNGLNPEPPTQPITASTSSVTVNAIATGTWTYTLTTTLAVTQPDGLQYGYSLSKTDEFVISCAGTLCGLTPCLESLKDTYYASYVQGKPTGLEPSILMILQLYMLAKEYKICGDSAKYQTTVAQLESLLDESGLCNCGCCNESNAPQWIDNGTFDAQTLIDQINSEVQSLITQVANARYVLFQGKQYYGVQESYTNVPLSLNELVELTFDSSYFDYPTVDGDFGKKFLTINIEATTKSTGGQVSVALSNGDLNVLFDKTFGTDDESTKLNVKLTLVVQKSGANMLLWVVQNCTILNGTSGTIEFYDDNANYSNIIAEGDDIVLNLRPLNVSSRAKTTYTNVTITASQSLI